MQIKMNFFKSPSIPSAARESQTFTKGGGYGGQIEWVAVNARCIPPLLVREKDDNIGAIGRCFCHVDCSPNVKKRRKLMPGTYVRF